MNLVIKLREGLCFYDVTFIKDKHSVTVDIWATSFGDLIEKIMQTNWGFKNKLKIDFLELDK